MSARPTLLKSVKRSVSFDASIHAWLKSTAAARNLPFCTVLNDVLRAPARSAGFSPHYCRATPQPTTSIPP